jgi:hypothetical protein
MEEEVKRLKDEIAVLKKEKLSMKVSEKGCVSIYGINRFPVSLYKNQWLQILDNAEKIKEFIKENDSKLSTK